MAFSKLFLPVAVLVLALGLPASYGQQGLDSAGQKQLAEWTVTQIKSGVGSWLTLADLYYGVETLAELSPASLKQLPSAEACKLALTPETLADHFYAASVISRLSCSGADAVAKAAEAAAAAALAAPASAEQGFHAVGALAALKAAGKKPKAPALEPLSALLAELVVASAGALRPSADVKAPSFAATGQAYAAIAAAKAAGFKGLAPAGVEAGAKKVLAAPKPDGGLWGKSDGDRLEATARVLAGAAALGLARSADAAKLARTAGYLGSALPAGSLSDAYFASIGLKALSGDAGFPAGVVLAPVSAAGAGGKGTATVRVYPAFGSSAPSCTVKGKATPKGGKAAAADAVRLSFKAGAGGAYTASFSGPLGAYTIDVEATDCDGSGLAAAATLDGAVADKATLSDVSVAAGSGKSQVATPPSGKLAKKVALTHDTQVKVSFSVTAAGAAFVPSQAMAVLTSKARPSAAAYFQAKAKGDALTAAITAAGIEKQLGTLGGDYTLSLLVGDAGMEAPVEWALGDVSVAFKPQEDGSQPEAPRETPAAFEPLPEILHMHRAPEKQPPAVVSLAFAAAVLAPLAGVALALGALKANLKGMPAGPFTLAFHGGIAAILLLYWAFWTKLNLLQTLPLLGVLGAVVFASGYFALSAHAEARLKNE